LIIPSGPKCGILLYISHLSRFHELFLKNCKLLSTSETLSLLGTKSDNN
jgi:hypothetical protein